MEKRARTLNAGFTLAEIMVIVIITGVLATLALTSYQKVMRMQVEQNLRFSLQTFLAAGQIYKARNGEYWSVNTTDLSVINAALGTNVPVVPGFTFQNTGTSGNFRIEVQENAGTLYMQVSDTFNDVCCSACLSDNMLVCI